MDKISLHTNNLTVGYKHPQQEIRLFESLNLRLPHQQLVCFMGPNGAGKSTLIRTLAGLQDTLHGEVEVLINDVAVDAAKISMARFISVVLTDRIATGNLTVYELVTFGRYPYLDWTIRINDHDKKIINAAINEVNIGHLIKRKIHELSDGQLQMAMIARALVQDTPVILLDEPTAHLDLNNRVEIMRVLKHLTRKANKTILIATHDLDLALQTADQIWLTGKNKNIITGIPEDLVLSGVFDDIFEFKGFDLKTGKVIHTPHQPFSIKLSGLGHPFLWTKNALERNGYKIDLDGVIEISIIDEGKLQWTISHRHETKVVSTVDDLIKHLQTISSQYHLF